MLTAGPITVKSSRVRDPIFVRIEPCFDVKNNSLKARKAAVTNRRRMGIWYMASPLCVSGGRSVHNSPSTRRNYCFSGIAIRTEREYRRGCDQPERAKRPKGRFVGMRPLESQAHHEPHRRLDSFHRLVRCTCRFPALSRRLCINGQECKKTSVARRLMSVGTAKTELKKN